MPELVNGELLEREMGQKSDSIAANSLGLIWFFLRENPIGLVNGAQGSYQVFPDDPDKVRIPDVSLTRRERLPKDGPAEGHGGVAPDLVIEVTSPNDMVDRLESKINDFRAAGVSLIWAVYPESKTVQVHLRDETGQRLQVGDILDGEDVLPGFRCEVASLFV